MKKKKKTEKKKTVDDALNNIQKIFGKNSIMKAGSISEDVDVTPTGSISLDNALGVGGMPKGRIIELYGASGAGKTTLALHLIAESQKLGNEVAYVDAEHALDIKYAKNIGVNTQKLIVSHPECGEDALDMIIRLIKESIFDIIVVDSVAALVPRAELAGEMGDSHMGLHARLMSQACRVLSGMVSRNNVTLIFINQLRCLSKNTPMISNGKITQLSKIKKNDHILNGNNLSVSKVTELINNNDVQGKKITLKQRGIFTLSNNHKQPVLSTNGYIEKYGRDIVVGDFLIQPIITHSAISNDIPYINLNNIIKKIKNNYIKQKFIKKIKLPSILDERLGFLLGCYYSDGYLGKYNDNKCYLIGFGEKNKDRYNEIKNVCLSLFGKKNVSIKTGESGIQLNGKYITIFFEELGCIRYSKNKVIPEIILASKLSVIKSFIRGAFFDTHGFSKYGFIFTNENTKETQRFANILYYMGVFADIRKDKSKKYNRLFFTGQDAINFNKIIGFAEKTKQSKAMKFTNNNGCRGKYDVVPYSYTKKIFTKIKQLNIKGISSKEYYSSLKQCLFKKMNTSRLRTIKFLQEMNHDSLRNDINFLLNNRFTEIIKIENKIFDAIDITIKNPNGLFIADRFLTHNSKIGVFYGPTETTTGGNALKFYASIRLDIRRIAKIITNKGKENEKIFGHKVRIKIIKNKVAPPMREVEIDIIYGKGFDKIGELLDIAEKRSIIDRSGSWYAYKENKIGQGREKAIMFLQEHKEIFDDIYKQIKR